MDWVVVGAQWLHVLLGIIWFGNSLVVAAILIPSLSPLPILTQREVGSRYGERATNLFNVLVPAVVFLAAMFAAGPRTAGLPFGRINDVLVLVSFLLAAPTAVALHGILRRRLPILSLVTLGLGLTALAAIVVLQALLILDVLTFEQQIGPVSVALFVLAVWFVLTGYLGSSGGDPQHGAWMGLLAATYVGYPIWAIWIGRKLAQGNRPVVTVAGAPAERGLARSHD